MGYLGKYIAKGSMIIEICQIKKQKNEKDITGTGSRFNYSYWM